MSLKHSAVFGILACAALEHQNHAVHWQGALHCALVVLCTGLQGNIAGERCQLAFVNIRPIQ